MLTIRFDLAGIFKIMVMSLCKMYLVCIHVLISMAYIVAMRIEPHFVYYRCTEIDLLLILFS